MNRRQSPSARIAGLVLAAIFAWPLTFAAANDEPTKGSWLVSTAAPASSEVIWGRLVVKDGMLTFFAPRGEWSTPLSAITRLSRVKGDDRSFAIETIDGEVLRLTVLGPQLLAESPKKAMQMIQRAVHETPRPVVSVTTTFSTDKKR